MKFADLQKISEACKTDAEFIGREEIRRVWWECMGQKGKWRHEWANTARPPSWADAKMCTRCFRAVDFDASLDVLGTVDCPVLPLIPGSLPDAVEALRAKVAEKWEKAIAHRLLNAITNSYDFDTWDWLDRIVHATPRQCFLDFVAVLGGVEVYR